MRRPALSASGKKTMPNTKPFDVFQRAVTFLNETNEMNQINQINKTNQMNQMTRNSYCAGSVRCHSSTNEIVKALYAPAG